MAEASDEKNVQSLLDIMACLRDPDDGCPWDLAQDFSTIAPYTIEEAYEVADAILRDDMGDLCDELGDLLFQVVFHSRMGEERGAFDFADVVAGIGQKLVRRHPHVFDAADAKDAEQVKASWEAIKAEERRRAGRVRESALDGVAGGMAPLRRAEKLQRRAAEVGFDWPETPPVLEKVREEIGEIEGALVVGNADALAHEIGDALFALVNLARHVSVDAELALGAANRRFEARFRHMERTSARDGTASLADLELDALEQLWRNAKQAERDGAL